MLVSCNIIPRHGSFPPSLPPGRFGRCSPLRNAVLAQWRIWRADPLALRVPTRSCWGPSIQSPLLQLQLYPDLSFTHNAGPLVSILPEPETEACVGPTFCVVCNKTDFHQSCSGPLAEPRPRSAGRSSLAVLQPPPHGATHGPTPSQGGTPGLGHDQNGQYDGIGQYDSCMACCYIFCLDETPRITIFLCTLQVHTRVPLRERSYARSRVQAEKRAQIFGPRWNVSQLGA